jgi:PIN domain nuclease of toxin-antitoxin system
VRLVYGKWQLNEVGPGRFSGGRAAAARRGLLDSGYSELPITSHRVVATESLPLIHRDPFDRILVAQATVEGVTLLTIDPLVSPYPGPIRTV